MRISDWSSDVCSSDLQDPRLRPQRLDQHRVPGLDALAHPARRAAVAAPQEQVLGDLLADRAGPAHPAAAGVAGARLLDGLEVETAVAGAVLVLGRDPRQRQAGRALAPAAPVVGNAEIPIPHAPALSLARGPTGPARTNAQTHGP